MPRIRRGEKHVAKTWQQVIVDQVRAGKVLPIISNSVGNDLVLGGHQKLIEDFSDYLNYPFEDKSNLPKVTQYAGVMEEVPAGATVIRGKYLEFVKSRLCDIAEQQGASQDALAELEEEFDDLSFSELAGRFGYPKFDDFHNDPWLVLVSLELPIYLTTSYHTFMESALKRAGKDPRTDICRWNDQISTVPEVFTRDYVPTKQEPLVYHLYGLDAYPESLVLLEDHYLEFLVAISQDKDRIPPRVRQALTDSSIILLGYDLAGGDFRSLFWGLIKPRPIHQQSVSVLQVRPTEEEKKYLRKYLHEVDFEVFWGEVREYVRRILEDLENC
jgi:hypothetical protein